MNLLPQKFSIRTVLLLTAVIAASTALVRNFGVAAYWKITHWNVPPIRALSESKLVETPGSEKLVKVSISNLSFRIPASLASQPPVIEGGRGFGFRDHRAFSVRDKGNRIVSFSNPSAAQLKASLGWIPEQLQDKTVPQLFHYVYSYDLSWDLSSEELAVADWVTAVRTGLAYDRMVSKRCFIERDGLAICVLHCTKKGFPNGNTKLSHAIVWATKNGGVGGLIHVWIESDESDESDKSDKSDDDDCCWVSDFVNSFTITQTSAGDEQADWQSMSSDEILSTMKIEATSETAK